MIPHYAESIDNKVRITTTGSDVLLGSQSITLECTLAEYNAGLASYRNGALIQEAFPFLSAQEREFLISGITAEAWDRMFPVDDDWDYEELI